MFDRLAKKGLSISVIVGTLLVPLTALAAIWLTDPGRDDESPTSATSATLATTIPVQVTGEAPVDLAADLEAACGPEGMQLVSLEESGAITDIQQAALDALRGVCEQEGIPLPSRPTVEPVLQTIVVPAEATAGTATAITTTTFEHDDDEFEHDDDEFEHEDDEFEHEDDEFEHDDDEFEHEDDEHEDDDRDDD